MQNSYFPQKKNAEVVKVGMINYVADMDQTNEIKVPLCKPWQKYRLLSVALNVCI